MDDEELHLYFVLRSIVLGVISGILLLSTVWLLGTIDFSAALGVSVLIFVASLVISRLFHAPITAVVRRLARLLGKHDTLRRLILRYL